MYRIENIVDRDNEFDSPGSWILVERKQVVVSLDLFGISPLPEIKSLCRASTLYHNLTQTRRLDPVGKHFTIKASITINLTSNPTIGFLVLKSPDSREKTRILYNHSRQQISVDRSASSLNLNVNSRTEAGPFRLFEILDGNSTRLETLDLEIFVDNSVIEVFANKRFNNLFIQICLDCSGLSHFGRISRDGCFC